MKRFLHINTIPVIFFILISAFMISGCNTKKEANENSATVDGAITTNNSSTNTKLPEVDLDFSKFNYNMISAEIFNIMIEPEKYVGKTIRFKGQFFSSFEQEKNQRFYSILIYDATACCQTGFEFILSGNPQYPQDFPVEGANIQLSGTLTYANLDGLDYFYIACDSFELLD